MKKTTLNKSIKPKDIEELYKKEKNAKVKQRLQIILLELRGYERKEIAKIVNLKECNILTWIKRFNEKGINGLIDKQRSGRPQKIKKEQKEKLKEDLKNSPKNFGYKDDSWITKLILFHLKNNYGISYSENYIQRFLRKLGLKLKKPRQRHYKAIKEERDEYIKLAWEYFKKKS